jgi:23S rRNA (cytosine1962-C5)-methyltransferase
VSKSQLNFAWSWREKSGAFKDSNALRVFHGPGEGQGDYSHFAVDRFGDHYWVTEWQSPMTHGRSESVRKQIVEYYRERGALSIVGMSRPEKGVAPESHSLWGSPPASRFSVREGDLQFYIQLENTRHPGLFLDHQPLRAWLRKNTLGMRVLNTFAYTGSLSVAAGVGGAEQVTTLDLSNPTIQWAKENMTLNQLSEQKNRFISGDVFEWLPRLKREKLKFDCVILDPPSFSRSKSGSFSTSHDLSKLHALAIDLLSDEGILVTSINSANVTWKKYESEMLNAAQSRKTKWTVVRQIDLPETFPTVLGQSDDRYLKGWILRCFPV